VFKGIGHWILDVELCSEGAEDCNVNVHVVLENDDNARYDEGS
jgi:hypothetical protein